MCFDVLMMCMWTKSSFWLPEIIIDVCTGDLTKHSPAVKLQKIHIQLLFYWELQFDILHYSRVFNERGAPVTCGYYKFEGLIPESRVHGSTYRALYHWYCGV